MKLPDGGSWYGIVAVMEDENELLPFEELQGVCFAMLRPGGHCRFTVQANNGLGAGTYEDELTIPAKEITILPPTMMQASPPKGDLPLPPPPFPPLPPSHNFITQTVSLKFVVEGDVPVNPPVTPGTDTHNPGNNPKNPGTNPEKPNPPAPGPAEQPEIQASKADSLPRSGENSNLVWHGLISLFAGLGLIGLRSHTRRKESTESER